jgi:hypothetical protein
MSRFFDLHDPVEKKYIFNSFLVVVALVEVIILVATIIWQIDDGWLSEQVKVIPFPWKEYLIVSFSAPIAMMFVLGIIIKGFDVFAAPGEAASSPGGLIRQWIARKFSAVAYIIGLLLLLTFVYGLIHVEKTLLVLKGFFSLLGLWGTYAFIGFITMAALYLPLSLWLRYRLNKKAMEYQYLLTLAERHGLVLLDAKGNLITRGNQDHPEQLPDSTELPPALPPVELKHQDL